MQLKVLGSSSEGNCYILDNGKEALIIECGISFNNVKKAIGYDISRVAAAILSHEHGDHSKHVRDFISARIPVYTSSGTASALGVDSSRVKMMRAFEMLNVGAFKVKAFDVEHDAAEPFGYLIHHEECGTVLFATDTYYLKYKFKGLNNILIEANYSLPIMLENIKIGSIPETMRKRVLKSHMSIETCCKTLAANDLRAVNNIVLIHLSAGNSDASMFAEIVEKLTQKNVYIADKNMIIDFNKSPF